MPGLIHVDRDARVLVLEDLGDGGDFTSMYGGVRLTERDCETLVDYLVHLRHVEVPADRRSILANREMRTLNHEHIFQYPLAEENGLALDAITPGLQLAADELKRDSAFVMR